MDSFHKSQIILGDCLDVLKSIPENSVDLVLTSPPYDSIRTYGGDWSLDLSKLGEQTYRVLKDGGIAVVVMQDQTKNFAKSLTSFRMVIDWCDSGFRLFECLIYSRNGRPGAWWNSRFRVDHEYMPVFLKGARPAHFTKEHIKVETTYKGVEWHGTSRHTSGRLLTVEGGRYNSDTKCRGTVWKYPTSSQENVPDKKIKLKHPATFPDALASDHIQCWCPEGGVVLDPLAGSGTTVVVAERLGRIGIGIEISPEYVEIGTRRLDTVRLQEAG